MEKSFVLEVCWGPSGAKRELGPAQGRQDRWIRSGGWHCVSRKTELCEPKSGGDRKKLVFGAKVVQFG